MKYMGSKARHSKEILAIIRENVKNFESNQWVEPFVGGANMIDKISRVSFERYGNDSNEFVISMFQALQKGWTPPDNVSEGEYKIAMSDSKDITNKTLEQKALIGFIGIGCSYSGKFFGGYARGNDSNGKPRNYCLESKKNLMAQKDKIQDVIFTTGDYKSMEIPPKSIIYCDPPYYATTSYKKTDWFNHDLFWAWCERKVKEGHMVFVSEYHAPYNWTQVWRKDVNNSLTKNTGSKQGTEKLFTLINN